MLSLEQQESFLTHLKRQTMVQKTLDYYFGMRRVWGPFGQYLIQDIVQQYSSINLTIQEVRSYVHGMVVAKKAAYLCEERSIQAFHNYLGITPVMPSPNTPFRLI